MSLNNTTATVPPSANAGTMAVSTSTANLMKQILSSKPRDWVLDREWMASSEVSVHLSLWNVTPDQWKSAWQQEKVKQWEASQASPECATRKPQALPKQDRTLNMEQLEKIRKEYGTENPYAWPDFTAKDIKQTETLSERASSTKLDGGTDAPVKPVLCSCPEASDALCGTSLPYLSLTDLHGNHGLAYQDAGTFFRQFNDLLAVSLSLEAGLAAQRSRDKTHDYSSQVSESRHDAQHSTSAVVNTPETRARETAGSFVVHSVMRFSLSHQDEAVAYDATPGTECGSLLRSARRLFRRMHA